MKVLVTGSTGFIGNYVMNELIRQNNYDIIATSIDSTEVAMNFEWFNKVKYIQCNLDDKIKNFYTFFEEPDSLIHLAWEGLPNYYELYHFERNLSVNYNFIKNMIISGLGNLSVIGTCLEYGLKEGCLYENDKTNPITPYGLAKDTLRKFIEMLNKKYDFSFKWIRLFYLYGKGQNPNSLLPQLDRALDKNEEIFNMSEGGQLRDYLPIEQVAEYITKITFQDKINGIINCCSGKPISIRKLVEDHLKKRNKSIKLNLGYYSYNDYEPMAFWGDNTKLLHIINNYKE
ncbi:hypothetical protein LCGC14_1183480 [marine sediment metagenome]|uniref:NAD-dependent epimerase/dehydratase domain-containing protein n=1 Tax=marine sediment metagenome TaxID=412755 RepID=A0A0F9P4B5_9ZZZZ